jgi:hypothetical protein
VINIIASSLHQIRKNKHRRDGNDPRRRGDGQRAGAHHRQDGGDDGQAEDDDQVDEAVVAQLGSML